MGERDISKIAQIEKDIFSIPWSENAFYDSLKSEDTLYVVAESENMVCGYGGMYLCPPEGNITNVAVIEQYRRQNIAKKMIEYLLQCAKDIGVTDVTLEVREKNVAAISLYEKLGFVEAGIRKNFYEKPTENALIMWKHNL